MKFGKILRSTGMFAIKLLYSIELFKGSFIWIQFDWLCTWKPLMLPS